jgi:FlaA1/EpsC-like NDP-sugar epimerase
MKSIKNWKNKKVLITGVCGTIGSELVRQLSETDVAHIVGIDNSETELFFISEEYKSSKKIDFFLCDLRDSKGLNRVMHGIDIVLHAAALKHVVLCEKSPRDAVSTNIQGMINIIDAADLNHVERFIFTSSDKAVNPTNVMGTTKLMGERLITAANVHRRGEGGTIYASTRFGNVLGSRGSVIPIFKNQILNSGPLTLTDESMTRFVMTLKEAVSLVLESVFIAKGGEVFVTKMPVIKIADLAETMIEVLSEQIKDHSNQIEIKTVGSKPGEKMYEELLNEEEVRRTIELKNFYAVLPAFKGIYNNIHHDYNEIVSKSISQPYNSHSEKAIVKEKLKSYLIDNQII